MTRAAGLSSVNCTQCGAGLSVLGGGRVLTHVCGYCGAVLDTQDNYKVLTSIGKRNHPASPVQIGMAVTVRAVPFTVIGTIGKLESWGGRHYAWVEHQLFSETHGYAWLNYEGGNFTFTRKIRDFNMDHWVSVGQVEAAETPPSRRYRGQTYKYYETSQSKIDFMEGEFNWTPALGETTTTVTLLGPDAMLGMRAGETEREVEITRLLPRAEVMAELGIDRDPALQPSFHPLTPYQPIREEGFLRRALAVSALLAILLAGAFAIMSGPQVLNQRGVALGSAQSFPFEIRNASQIARLRFETDISNAWAVIGTRITGPDGQTVVEGERLVQFYSGRDADGAWSEGSRDATLRFRPQAPGPHQIQVSRVEGTGGRAINVLIDEGKPTPFWLVVAAIVFGLGYAGLIARKAMHSKRRFSGGDWHEE